MDAINGQKMFPQMRTVKKHLDSGHTITQKEANAMYGIGRLAVVISRLNKRGEGIRKDLVTITNCNGTSVIAKYYKHRGGAD